MAGTEGSAVDDEEFQFGDANEKEERRKKTERDEQGPPNDAIAFIARAVANCVVTAMICGIRVLFVMDGSPSVFTDCYDSSDNVETAVVDSGSPLSNVSSINATLEGNKTTANATAAISAMAVTAIETTGLELWAVGADCLWLEQSDAYKVAYCVQLLL